MYAGIIEGVGMSTTGWDCHSQIGTERRGENVGLWLASRPVGEQNVGLSRMLCIRI